MTISDKLVASATQNIAADEELDRLMQGIQQAEMGPEYLASHGISNPFIRTLQQGTGSSAYGPYQMTAGGPKQDKQGNWTESMMYSIFHDKDKQTKMGLTDDDMSYIQRYLEQGNQFLQPVSDENLSIYGYGGKGDLSSPQDQTMYEQVARKIMKYEYDRAGQDPELFLKNWKMGSTKSMDDFYKWVEEEGGQEYVDRFYSQFGVGGANR